MSEKKTQFQKRKEKELLTKTKDLISMALGLDEESNTALKEDVNALAEAIKDVKETAVMEVMKEEIRKDVPMPENSPLAFGVELDEKSMTYYMTTVSYNNGYAKIVSRDAIGKSMAEANYKVSKRIVDHLLEQVKNSNKKS